MAELRKVNEESVGATHRAEKTLSDLLCTIEKHVDTLKETIKEKENMINISEVIFKEKLEQQEQQLEEVKKKAYRKKN